LSTVKRRLTGGNVYLNTNKILAVRQGGVVNNPKKRPVWKDWFRNKFSRFAIVLAILWWRLVIRSKPDFIFLVYGQERHRRACWSKRKERKIGLFGQIGFIRYPGDKKNSYGIILASTIRMEEFSAAPQLAVNVTDEVKRRFPEVQEVALAGQLPGWLSRISGAPPQRPLIGGMRGTCFTVRQAVREISLQFSTTENLCVAVVGGAGHTGTEVVRVLAQEYERIIAFDSRFQKDETIGNVLRTSKPYHLCEAKVVVVLTAKGDDARTVAVHLSPGTVVADDTHPMMSKETRKLFIKKGASLVKITVGDGRVRMFPPLPDFKPGDVPGCLLEALVVKLRGPQVLDSQGTFNRAAEELGFKSRLENHPGHS